MRALLIASAYTVVLLDRPRRVSRGPRVRPVRLLQRDLVDALPRVLEEEVGGAGLQVGHGRPKGRAARRAETTVQGRWMLNLPARRNDTLDSA